MKNHINKPDILKWYIYKILLIMRLTTVILMISILQVNAATVAQEFNYVKKGVSLIQIFKEIKKQTGYNIIWNEKKIDVTTLLDADFKKSCIEEVLNKCLSNLNFSYSIDNKMIMLHAAASSASDKVVSFITAIDVRGRVVDDNNAPLVGAVVKVKGSSISTTTNSNGEFLLRNVDEKAVLVISFIGYEGQEIEAAEKLGSIQLIQSTGKLEEVEINAGYYTVTERERTGSISKITDATIKTQPVNNPIMALVGRISGLQITQQTGMPGGGFTVQIRGQNSITSGNDPLYIIDGVIYPSQRMSGGNTSSIFGLGTFVGASPLSSIDPNDIESIEVLKDADATAIYGSRGANGVILITTKKGISGIAKVAASVSQGYSEVGHKVNLLDTEEYLAMRREALTNDGLAAKTTDYDINGTWDQNRYTDWQDVFIGGTSKTTNAALNIVGGVEKSNYLIGGSYYSEGTVFPGSFGFKRINFRSSANIGSVTDRFNATFTGNFSHVKQNLIASDLTSNIFLAPNAPELYDAYGNLNYSSNTLVLNPFAKVLRPNDAGVNNLLGNLSLSYRLLKKLTIKASIGYSSITRDEFLKYPLAAEFPGDNPTSANRISLFSDNYNKSLLFEPLVTYKEKFRSSSIEVLVGMSLQSNNSQFRTIRASDYSSDQLMDNIAGAAVITNSQMDFSEYKYIAGFTRLNYNLYEKYFINLTARRDGSSRFGFDRQFANFGAIGAAWIFSNEKFFKDNLPLISFGKIRGSYGITGNDQIGNYGYLQLWNSATTYQGKTTIIAGSTAPNPYFSWETNRKLEAALQFGILRDNITTEISYYRNRSSNQLLNNQLAPSTGLSSVFANSPGEVQNTGWEFQSNIKIITGKNWHWTSSINLSIPKNKLLAYPGLESSSQALNYEVGEPLSIRKVYNVAVENQTGLYKAEDRNGNGVTDNGDRYLIRFLGQHYYGGLQSSIKYKHFNLDFHFYFAKQDGYKPSATLTPGRYLYGNEMSNQISDVLNRWQQSGDNTMVQRFGTTSITANTIFSNFGNLSMVDASFVRLRNLSLSYSLPKKWTSKIKINNAAISLQGQNLFTITNYVGLDPETQSNSSLPPLRTLTMGLNLTF